MKVNLYNLDGKAVRKIDLPDAFDTPIRQDLIRRAVTTYRANRRQPYGPNPRAGQRHSVEWWGKGRGASRTPRLRGGRRGAEAPNTVGGRRAHPPTPEKDWSEKMNKKERRLARKCALAASANKDTVINRGHIFDDKTTVPLVFVDKIEEVGSTKEIIKVFQNVGVHFDLDRAKNGRHIRAGRGKMRDRRYKTPKSLLVVVKEFKGVEKAVGNLPGVSITPVNNLNTEDLAPGGDPGRLTVFSSSALKEVSKW